MAGKRERSTLLTVLPKSKIVMRDARGTTVTYRGMVEAPLPVFLASVMGVARVLDESAAERKDAAEGRGLSGLIAELESDAKTLAAARRSTSRLATIIGSLKTLQALRLRLLEPPPGWFVFGHHHSSTSVLQFWGQDPEDGMPLWERPIGESVPVAVDRAAILEALIAARTAARGDSTDAEIDALRSALDLLAALGGFDDAEIETAVDAREQAKEAWLTEVDEDGARG